MFSEVFLREQGFSLDDFGYYFDRYFSYPAGIEPIYQSLTDVLSMWQEQHRERDVFLSYQTIDDTIRFEDTRFGSDTAFTLGYPEKEVYLAVEPEPISISGAVQKVARNTGLSSARVWTAFDALIERRLLWVEGEQALGLAIEREIVESHRATDWKRQWGSVFVENTAPASSWSNPVAHANGNF
jgi:hypothetical protein